MLETLAEVERMHMSSLVRVGGRYVVQLSSA